MPSICLSKVCITLLLHLLVCCMQVVAPPRGNKLVVILMDGFRWDYFKYIKDGKGFQAMIDQGVKAEFLQSDFPSLSYVNYYSIMTGLHGDRHGMVNNFMYDIKHDEYFLLGRKPNVTHSFWWEDGEPLWITATKQGLRAHMFDWSGCEVSIHGVRPMACRVYHSIPTLDDTQSAVDKTIQLFQAGMADFVGIYAEYPDHTGHAYGTDSDELTAVVNQLDSILFSLLDMLQKTPGPDGVHMLNDSVNVVVVSDHGMVNIQQDRIVDLSLYLDTSDVEHTAGCESVYGLWPKEGQFDKVYKDLLGKDDHMKVYRKQDLPQEWHIASHYRTPPITLVADLGWTILTPEYPEFPISSVTKLPMAATHGYNNTEKDMHGIFLGIGPNFKPDYTQPGFPNVDIYQMMCAILGIYPAPNDGNWEQVSGMLRNIPLPIVPLVSFKSVIVTGVVAFFSMGGICLFAFAMYCCRTSKVKHYRPVHNMDESEI